MKILLTTLLACCLYGSTAHAQQYELVVLDDTSSSSGAYGINSYGVSTGYKVKDGKLMPYLWLPDGSYLEMPAPTGLNPSEIHGIGYSITDDFSICGTFAFTGLTDDGHGSGSAVVWQFDELHGFVATRLPGNLMSARSMNLNGDIAGITNVSRALMYNLWTGSSFVPNSNDSTVYGVNALGNGTGSYQVSGATYQPFYLRKGVGGYTVTNGPSMGGYNCKGMSINTNNQIVGIVRHHGPFASIILNGFYWEPETGANILFPDNSECYSISEGGLIVGALNGHATMWNKVNGSYVATDLNSLVSNTNTVLTKAYGVNVHGQIVGQCTDVSTGNTHAYLLTPARSARAQIVQSDNNELTLSWDSTVDHIYRIRFSEDLMSWQTIPGMYWADTTNSYVRFTPEGAAGFFTIMDLTP